MRTLSFGNMILLFLIIISSRTVLSNDPGCKDVAKNIEESLSSIETTVNGNLKNIGNSLTLLKNWYYKINHGQVNFQDKQESLDTQLRNIHSEVKEIKEKSFAKVKQSEAFETSTDIKLEMILGEVNDLKNLRNMTGLLMDKHNVLNSEVKTVLSVVERLQEIREDSPLKQDYKIVCYFINWVWHRLGKEKFYPEDIDPTLCTHLNYAYADVDDSSLLIRLQDSSLDPDSDFYAKVTSHKKSGVKVLITIGGWSNLEGSKYSKLVNDSSARENFNTNALAFCKKYGFDGINLDWELPVCWQGICSGPATDKAAFASWVKELSALFHPEGMLVTAAVSANYTVIDQVYDVPVLSEYLDMINVITYNYHGHWDGKTGHISPLYAHPQDSILQFNTHYTINYWIQKGADPKKLIMGIPFYGRSFTLANSSDNGLNARSNGGGTAGQFTRKVGVLSYYEICFALSQGWTSVQDPLQTMGPYAYSGNQWVSYNDIPMVQKNCEYIREKGLGGAMIWSLDYDDFKNRCGQGSYPLLKTVNKALGRQ